MRKLIFVFLSLFIFSTITLPEPSLASTQQKKTSVKSSKEKAVVKSSKNGASVKSSKKKTAVKPSNKKVVKQNNRVKVRYSHNINKLQEGDLLKLEGMVKDLNEQ
ncbi:MAG: hypothetical protein ACO2PP_11180 [Thermocrinis sp.]|jgi:hypothetical protein|uniref:hypothetical protein n=1 Tax=Thermocrinis sp. TaxID=2024383 RepID=UPI003C04E3C7